MKRQTAIILVLAINLISHSVARDWPGWLGPDGNNTTTSSDNAPINLDRFKEAWTAEVGNGYSAVTVADGRAWTIGHDTREHETVFCFDAATGTEIWKHSYKADLIPRMHPGGPNATPTVVGDTLLTISKDGQLFALNAANGAFKWSKRLTEAMGIELPTWGFGGSPVVASDHILASAGKVVSLELDSGDANWISSVDHKPGYATPVAFERTGMNFVLAFDGEGISVLNAADGTEIARRAFKAQFDLNATTPEVLDDGNLIFVAGNTGSEMLRFDGTQLKPLWSDRSFKNAMNNSVIHDDVIYGINGKQGQRSARFVALDASSGETIWQRDEFGYGTVIGVGSTLLALTEKGELVTIERSRSGYTETSRRKVLDKTCWTTPTYADGRIYMRNNVGRMICLAEK